MLRIHTSDAETATKGNFGITIAGGVMTVPMDIAAITENSGLQYGEDLFFVLQNLPTAVAKTLCWEINEVEQAAAILKMQLQGIVNPAYLAHPNDHPQFPLEALHPGTPAEGKSSSEGR